MGTQGRTVERRRHLGSWQDTHARVTVRPASLGDDINYSSRVRFTSRIPSAQLSAEASIMAPMSGSGDGGGSTRRRPLRQPPVVDDDDDVGCSCPKQRLLRSLLSSLVSRARGALGGRAVSRPKSSAPSSSASTITTAAAFTSTSSTGASATTVDSSVESWGPATYAATNTLYEEYENEERRRQRRKDRRRKRRRAAREEEEGATAVAVEVESAVPYEDFRESMVAMVVEKEMYAWEELNALLHQFLTLNSPRHHAIILHAFADLWAPRSGLFCAPSPCQAL
uniref:Transcription repressor n=1 Tax=Oryza punctata TaxID=4537 RepID=A0A0E0L330_ORYPU